MAKGTCNKYKTTCPKYYKIGTLIHLSWGLLHPYVNGNSP